MPMHISVIIVISICVVHMLTVPSTSHHITSHIKHSYSIHPRSRIETNIQGLRLSLPFHSAAHITLPGALNNALTHSLTIGFPLARLNWQPKGPKFNLRIVPSFFSLATALTESSKLWMEKMEQTKATKQKKILRFNQQIVGSVQHCLSDVFSVALSLSLFSHCSTMAKSVNEREQSNFVATITEFCDKNHNENYFGNNINAETPTMMHIKAYHAIRIQCTEQKLPVV